jgi:hypothetical protein
MPTTTPAFTAASVRVAVSGAIYVAKTTDVALGGTTPKAPTDATTALDAIWHNVGYIHSDGVKEANTTESSEIKAWQNSDVVRKTITKQETSYNFKMIETNTKSLGLFYGQDIAVGAKKHTIGGSTASKVSVVIDIIDGTDKIRRFIPDAEVTEKGEVVFAAAEAVGYDVTLTCYPNSIIGGSVEVHYGTALPEVAVDKTTP